MKKISPIKAYAILKKKNPKLTAHEIYADKEVVLNGDEMIIEVVITSKS